MSDGSVITCADLRRVEEALCAIRELMDERHRLYTERDISAKDAVKSALAVTQLAADKTEMALKEYKTGANEWRDTVKDLVNRMPTRVEIEKQLHAVEEKVADLRESRSGTRGRDDALEKARATYRWVVGLGITTVLSILVQALTFWARTR